MKHKYIILNKYGRVHAIAMSVHQISNGLGIPLANVYTALDTGKPLAGKYLILKLLKYLRCWVVKTDTHTTEKLNHTSFLYKME